MEKVFASSDHRTVVVGVDGSMTSTVTVELAAAEAARRAARLLIVHAWPGHYRGRFRIRSAHRGQAEGSQLLAAAARHAAAADPELIVETELRAGLPGDALAEWSREAGLLVIGHRDGQTSRPDWGSTARALARTCHCPLLVHQGRCEPHGPVVTGVSGRPNEPALGHAFVQAALAGADLVAAHAWRRPADQPDRHPLPITVDDPHRRAVAERLAAALVEWSWRLPQVAVQPLVVPDLDVPYTLDRALRRARLLVAGTGGRGELTELISTPPKRPAGHHGFCPVLLVPPDWPVELPDGTRAPADRVTG
ncbi:nucleotide-binding universal stress UspA family protein [Actinoplanes octamycinicus]|uniref:Nucleotide-binding universal stress UspA family protein n=1 Tax=Actinoplanes octamycinicus TaxID=135948 RepID=A0A7W7H2T5_9ACTN|nr:universal stress protein [Actinoplanes octamycinicus]MBB4742857.1 nucleotide-binding universal stress UspA family protein [Actinoplanes octamycinicus]GIE58290.1 universal stress protein [Actinoplanes octamycinicus]